jgi:hypothetical protein
MSKQTALQWYIQQCENIKYNPLEKNGYTIAKEKIIKQALEMEREQMIEFSQEVFVNRYNQVYETLSSVSNETYKQTYGGNNDN